MKRILQKLSIFKQFDWILISLVFVLLAFSFASIYSIDISHGGSAKFFSTQLIAFTIGSIAFFVAAGFHMTFYQTISKPLYFAALFLLVGVLLFGENIRGTTGWFRIGGFSFQPAEFAKLALILSLGYLVKRQGRKFYRLQFVILSGLVLSAYAVMVMMQPDLGSTLVLGGIWFGILLLSGIKKRYTLGLIFGLVIAFFVAWSFLFKDYQRDRLMNFLNPQNDLLYTGYNVNQSIIAIGAGRVFGRGLGFGSQSQLHFLPEAQTDFIFSVIGEELGFIGSTIVLTVYFLLFIRLIYVAKTSRDDFGAYIILGIVLLFLIQVVFNIGAATGLLPVTGLTLPFISYGGSSLIINMVLLGIAESVARSNWEHQKTNILFG